MASKEKQYGLIDPKKKLTVADVFNAESDSDQERGSKDWIKKKLQKDAERGLKKQTVIDMNRALEEDPTVYQYDEVYDNLKETSEQNKAQPKKEKKAKYMDALIKTADRRKKENERRTERLAQKEREAEGDEFKDKEEFITSAYRQKLEDMKKADEEEKKMELIESINDVTKQEDMGSFYRQLYKDTVSEEKTTEVKEEKETETKAEKSGSSSSSGSSSDSSSSSNSSSGEDDEDISELKQRLKDAKNKLADVSSETTVAVDSAPKEPQVEKPNSNSSPQSKKSDDIPPLLSVVIKSPEAPEEKGSKFASNSRKERTYRQRAPSPTKEERNDVKKKEEVKTPQRDRDRRRSPGKVTPKKDDRNYSRDDRGRERERERDATRRGDEWRSSSDRRTEDRRRDDRRRRTRTPPKRNSDKRSSSPKRPADRRDIKRPRDSSDANERDIKKSKSDSKVPTTSRTHPPEEKIPKEIKKSDSTPDFVQESKEKVAEPKFDSTQNNGTETRKNATSPLEVKIDIWAKRTVGPAFEEALQKYYQRKAAKAL